LAKLKTTYYCQNCGANSPKWMGKCSSCGEWNTYIEEIVTPSIPSKDLWQNPSNQKRSKPQLIQEIEENKMYRFTSGNLELDRVLGGGIVNGSIVLIGGEPGIGKSTLMLQTAVQIRDVKVLYISGEESLLQIKMRAERIGISSNACFLLSETSLTEIFKHTTELDPDILIIDSIQTVQTAQLESTPGSISQVRESAGQLIRYGKETNTPVFLIGHINKEGNIAGPKVLEHMVDTVLQFEGDNHNEYRILRTIKNRYGSTSELGIFHMKEDGLDIVLNPSEILLSNQKEEQPGVAIGASIEGNRTLLVEVQALVSPATYGTPQRSTTGFDLKRLHMLLAVLEKRLGLKLGTQDVFLNITGGIRISDPSIDLAVCSAVYSSYHNIPISSNFCMIGEVGLGGEVRQVSRIDNRIKEAEKLGFTKLFMAQRSDESMKHKVVIMEGNGLRDIFKKLFS